MEHPYLQSTAIPPLIVMEQQRHLASFIDSQDALHRLIASNPEKNGN